MGRTVGGREGLKTHLIRLRGKSRSWPRAAHKFRFSAICSSVQPLEARLTYSAPQYPDPAWVQHQKECAALSMALPVPGMLECRTQAPGEAGFSEDYRSTPKQLHCSRSQPGVSTNWIIHLWWWGLDFTSPLRQKLLEEVPCIVNRQINALDITAIPVSAGGAAVALACKWSCCLVAGAFSLLNNLHFSLHAQRKCLIRQLRHLLCSLLWKWP